MNEESSGGIWLLGATGRIGRALAVRLADRGIESVVLVGRREAGLNELARSLRTAPAIRVHADVDTIVADLKKERPAIVINMLGSYAETGPMIARACMPGGSYVDLANDLTSLAALLDMDDEAVRTGSTVVTGAGFGVLGTEAIVARLCEGKSTPTRVQVDALASYASEDGILGRAFAQTSVDVLRTGGRHFLDGELASVRLGANRRRHVLPDGTTVSSAAVPSGELLAARIASGAPNVDFTSALAPTSPLVGPLLPLVGRLAGVSAVGRLLVRLMARSKTRRAPRPRPHTWGHAVVTWADGNSREGWLRADDAMDFTADVLAAVAVNLARGVAPSGAYTPAAAFGYQLAVDAGGALIDG